MSDEWATLQVFKSLHAEDPMMSLVQGQLSPGKARELFQTVGGPVLPVTQQSPKHQAEQWSLYCLRSRVCLKEQLYTFTTKLQVFHLKKSSAIPVKTKSIKYKHRCNKTKPPPFNFPPCIRLKLTDQERLKKETYHSKCKKLFSINYSIYPGS